MPGLQLIHTSESGLGFSSNELKQENNFAFWKWVEMVKNSMIPYQRQNILWSLLVNLNRPFHCKYENSIIFSFFLVLGSVNMAFQIYDELVGLSRY